jgi:hypothetical protein
MNMSNRNTQKNDSNNGNKNVEVLYQKMGNRWFAFSIVGGDVFTGSISQEEIDALEAREAASAAETFGIRGNS